MALRAPCGISETPDPTSITGSHTSASTRAARAASVSPRHSIVALSVPMRRLAPPVKRSAGRRLMSCEWNTRRRASRSAASRAARRFCTLPSGVVTRVATTAVWRVETTSSTTTSAPMSRVVPGVRRTLPRDELRSVQPVAELLTREVEEQVEVELVPRGFVRDRDVGRARSRFEAERDPQHEQQREDDPDRDPQRHVRSRARTARTPA